MMEIRSCEIRASEPAGTEGLFLEGFPIVYDKPTVIHSPAGVFTEIIRSGALDGADISDARLLYNHDLNTPPLAKTPRTMQFTLDPAGLKMKASLAPESTTAKDVHTAVARGDLSGMSFKFTVPKGGDKWTGRTREIHKIAKVYEVSIVPFPAYTDTSIEARAALQSLESPERREMRLKINKMLFKGAKW